MAGGKGASSSCQDRERTREGIEGEKLSSITLKTLPSAEEMCVCVCLLMCVSNIVYGARCAGRSESWCQAPRLLHS